MTMTAVQPTNRHTPPVSYLTPPPPLPPPSPPPCPPAPPQGRQLYVAPAVKEQHSVCITFQMPCLHQHYEAKAEHYISHLVGHEGPGSLLSELKVRGGWA